MKTRVWDGSEKRMLAFSAGICLLLLLLGGLHAWNNRIPDLHIPETPQPQNNALAFYRRAVESYVEPPPDTDSHLDTSRSKPMPFGSAEYQIFYPLARKQAALQANAPALKFLRQGLQREYSQPPERNGKQVVNYSRYRDFARLLIVEAHARAQQKNWDGAADSLLDTLKLGYQTPRGGALIAGLSGIAIRARAYKDFLIVLPHLSADKARDVSRRIAALQATAITPAQILEEEKRAMQGVILKMLRRNGLREMYVAYGCGPEPCDVPKEQYERDLNALPIWLKLRLSWMNKPHILAEYTRCMDWQIKRAKMPYPLRDKSWPFPDPSGQVMTDQVASLMYPEYSRARLNFHRGETKDSFLCVLSALHAYHLENKKYPRALSELVPRYLARVPLDPFSNRQPLKYRLKPVRYIAATKLENEPGVSVQAPGGPGSAQPSAPIYAQMPFTLYSVGLNARDDGGRPFEQERSGETRYQITLDPNDTQSTDIVAGINF